MKKIGFFGDSFCRSIKNDHSSSHGYETYIEKLSNNLEAEIVHLGVGGSSVWDCVLLQFQETVKTEVPDICVFVWTESHRLFHRTFRNLNFSSIETSDLKKKNIKLYNASVNYFHHLYDCEKHDLEYISLLHYVDKQILPRYKNTKFIHLWSFKDSVMYRWENGVEIRPALMELVSFDTDDLPGADKTANHIGGEEKNTLLHTTILDAINNYANGKLITFDTQGINYD